MKVDFFAGENTKITTGGPRKFPGFAHFPGTGPEGKRCRDCKSIVEVSKTKHVCRKWAEMMRAGDAPAKWNPMNSGAEACKYFEQSEVNK